MYKKTLSSSYSQRSGKLTPKHKVTQQGALTSKVLHMHLESRQLVTSQKRSEIHLSSSNADVMIRDHKERKQNGIPCSKFYGSRLPSRMSSIFLWISHLTTML